MQEYDVALKLLLQGSATLIMRELTGTAVAKWLDVELPKVQNLRLDLLGETVDGGLVHVELQSSNDAAMPLRMAEYCLGVFRLFGRFPRQVVLYVGEPQLLVGGSPVICTHLLVCAKGGSTTITLLGGPSTLAVPTACTVDGGAPSGVGSKFELNNVFGVVRNTIFPRSVTL